MKKNKLAIIPAIAVALSLVASGCIVIKDDRGRHRGHYKQPEKTLKKSK